MICKHGGDDVLAEVIGAAGGVFIVDEILAQLLPVEDVDAHRGLGGFRVLGLLFELVDRAVLVGVHDTEAGSFLKGDIQDGDGGVCLFLLVVGEHLRVVHLVDVVAGEDEDIFGVIAVDEIDILIDGVGGALVPLALLVGRIRGEDVDAAVHPVEVPGLAVADVGVEFKGAVLGEDADGVDAGVCAVGEGKVDDAVLAAKGNSGLCDLLGEDVQAAALSACEKHGNHFFLLFHDGTPRL